ncbi:MAG: Alcohol dehydrogenase (quinone), cytochrome c subunit [Bacteroidia bacterium]|nr:Alcohol dehydrogenase (quinone), cytochrome c subunit [Bacteroidia bacterium]
MKTFLKILKWIGIILGVLILVLVIAVYSLYPPKFDAPKVEITASKDSAVIAHGKYLVYGPAHCAECHIKVNRKDLSVLETAMQTQPLSGGLEFTMPGAVVYSGNLTPDKENGTGRYTDSELARLIKYCTKPDNTLLFPFMAYSGMTEQDVTAIVSYLRTLEPVKNTAPPHELSFMMKGFVVFLFKEPFLLETNAPKSVARDTTAEYGKYLANKVSGCEFCHTNADMMTGKMIGKPYAGGQQTPPATEEQGVWVYSPNLTPDPETGRIYGWTEEMFIQRFRQGRMVKESIMPWECFKTYSDNDLKAVYKYLQTLEPVKNEVKEVVVREK